MTHPERIAEAKAAIELVLYAEAQCVAMFRAALETGISADELRKSLHQHHPPAVWDYLDGLLAKAQFAEN